MTDKSYILMKLEQHYNLLTKLTPLTNNIIELAVTLQKGSIKTCYNEVNVILTEANGSGVGP